MKLAYYPGCSLESTGTEYDMSTKEVFKALDIELCDLGDWNCCGSSVASSKDYLLSLALPARNLAMSEKLELDVMAPCPECYLKLWKARDAVKKDPDTLDKVNKALDGTGLELKGSIDVKHPAYVIVNELGLEKLAERVKKPLDGLKVVPYYGCVMLKPPRDEKLDSPENPTGLDRIITTLGGEVVPFASKVKCCGGGLILTNKEVMLNLTHEILKEAKDAGADCIITACPLCHLALDGRQIDVEKEYNEKIEMPILYFTQLIGLSLGIGPKKLGLDKNFISTQNLLKSLKL
ncbi:CoB--CoM heterodisulfide reductase iron-sulfur subunit B family protein [archaeon]|nr:CoB--CoM heterodisulfide reductase iron-sulfur subunit B family protein [archaeon]